MPKSTDTGPGHLQQWVEQSTRAVRGESNFGNDALLLPNVRYGNYPLILQQETLLSSNAKIVYNNIWTYAQDQRGGATSACLFPTHDYLKRVTGLANGTITSCLVQLRLKRYITQVGKLNREDGRYVGNDYILNDEPMELGDTLNLDHAFFAFVEKSINANESSTVAGLARLIRRSLTDHVETHDDPFKPATAFEKIQTRNQAAQLIHHRVFDEPLSEDQKPTHYFGIPIDEYNKTLSDIEKTPHKNTNDQEQILYPVTNRNINQANDRAQNLYPVMRCSSSGSYIKTTTTNQSNENQDNDINDLEYPEFETPNELCICKLHIARLPMEQRQPTLDELAARMASPSKKPLDNPISYLKSWLIKQLEQGEIPFTSEGSKLAAMRDNPDLFQSKQVANNEIVLKANVHALQMDIKHLDGMIDTMKKTCGEETYVELVKQRSQKHDELRQLLRSNSA